MKDKTAKADVHFHPAMLDKLRAKLEDQNQIAIMARRDKSKRNAKLAEFGALEAVLAFLDQLNIESYPLLRVWDRIATEVDSPRKRGRPSKSESTRETRAYALVAAELLVRGGMPAEKADKAIELRFKEAGVKLAPSTLRHWRDDFSGKADDAAKKRSVIKEHAPSAVCGLMGDKEAYRQAAGIVLRELDVLIRLR